MASLSVFFCAALVVATMVNAVAGASTEFKVGDDGGWRQPEGNNTALYSQWAEKIRFNVGDSLNFEYRNDSVLVVDKGGYYHCNTTNPISSFNNGKTVIKLDRPGGYYFISGAPGHCKDGQRLVVNVLNPHAAPENPPLIAVPPQPQTVDQSPAPSPLPSSGISVTVALFPVLMILTATLVTVASTAP